MYYYYSRVSTSLQNSARQLENFKSHGDITSQNLFVDKISGNVPFRQRPEAVKLIDAVTSRDKGNVTIVIDSIDRLGRNLVDIHDTIAFFTRNEINIKSLKEGFETMINGKENQFSKVSIALLASIAELERGRIRERQAEGILLAKAKGMYRGRKVGSNQSADSLLARYPVIVQKLKKGMSVRDISKITANSTTTILKVKKAIGGVQSKKRINEKNIN